MPGDFGLSSGMPEIDDVLAEQETTPKTHSARAFEWTYDDLSNALRHLRGLRIRPDEELRKALVTHGQESTRDSVFDLAQQIAAELDQLQSRLTTSS